MNTQHTHRLEQSELKGSYLPASVSWAQLEPGAFDVGYHVVDAAPLRVSFRGYNLAFQAQAAIEATKAVIAITGDVQTRARWFGTRLDADTIATSRSTIDVRTNAPSSFFAVTVDEAALQRDYPNSRDAADLLEAIGRVNVARNHVGAASLRAGIGCILSRPATLPLAITDFLLPLLARTLNKAESLAIERSTSLNRRFAAVRSCECYMREHVDAPVTLLDLSQLSGMRSRTLINAFEAITGMAPMEYLKRLRLNGVHRALERADKRSTRVIDVATAWGFWHMGHFAADYRSMFGEPPSHTLLNN